MRLNYIPRRNIFEPINYGYLYNWYAATDVREIANVGWHVPTSTELSSFISYVSANYPSVVFAIKDTDPQYWENVTGVTNATGFSARGGGERNSDGTFDSFGTSCIVNSVTEFTAALNKGMFVTPSSVFVSNLSKKDGECLRLIKDSTTLSDGQTGTYTGNDGKIYPTICIGTQEWLTLNLKETQYRNGDPIPEVTDNTAWAALTTGGRCSYNNNEANA